MKKIIGLLQLIFACLFGVAQTPLSPVITMTPIGNNYVQFSAGLRPLCQMAGAPNARYAYFWEFGDGTFSDAPLDGNPKHQYKASGDYQVLLCATNTYDNCATPPLKQQTFTVRVNTSGNTKWDPGFFGTKDRNRSIKMKVSRNPKVDNDKVDNDLIAYIGYRNRLGDNFSGSLTFFYNDKRFLRKSFRLLDKRTYHGEEGINSNPEAFNTRSGKAYFMLQELKKNYMDHTVFRFNNLQKGDENFIFVSMRMLPEMEVEADEVITMTAVIIPDNPSLDPEKFELPIKIVRSHDPNQMLLRESRINYRFMKKKKELNYKVQFQNYGEGPARNISVGIELPKQLNTATIKVNEISPTSFSCDSIAYRQQSCVDTIMTADSIHFLIKNIYLPGQKEKLVKHDDSTKGYISYSIRFKKKPKKIPFSSRAVIVFDQNKPVYTNKATARFIKGFSPGIIAGYSFYPSSEIYSAKGPVQIGYVLAPYAPSRPYFQVELHASVSEQENSTKIIYSFNAAQIHKLLNLSDSLVIDPKGTDGKGSRRETILSKRRNALQVVPFHFRYNINNWIGLGVGVMGQVAVSEQIVLTEKYGLRLYDRRQRTIDSTLIRTSTSKTVWGFKQSANPQGSSSKTWIDAKFAPFLDIQIGRVRTGPTLGLRYYRQWQGNIPNRFFVYAGIKL